jgi:predicted acyl esterase
VVDVRGRGNSEGRCARFGHDGVDGADAVEWLARLPGCDGQVAMRGGRYAGFVQWATIGSYAARVLIARGSRCGRWTR